MYLANNKNITAPCTLASSVDSWKGDNFAEVTYTHKYVMKDSDTHKCLVDGCDAEEAHSFTDGVEVHELAHKQMFFRTDIYGERRENEQLCCECSAWRSRE